MSRYTDQVCLAASPECVEPWKHRPNGIEIGMGLRPEERISHLFYTQSGVDKNSIAICHCRFPTQKMCIFCIQKVWHLEKQERISKLYVLYKESIPSGGCKMAGALTRAHNQL